MMAKRLRLTGLFLGLILLVLIGRLAYIQLAGHEELSRAASAQQLISLEGANSRGMIYDRNGTPLVGNNQEYIYIIRESCFDGETMNALNRLKAEEIKNGDNGYRVFASETYDKRIGERLIRNSSAYIIEAGRRYSQNQKAVHILGYVNPKDSSGASGVELMCDAELSLLNKRIFTTADVRGKILQGRGLLVTTAKEQDSYVKQGVATTLEAGLQEEVEKLLAQAENNGAAVVLKVRTGEIVASASTPVFDPAKVDTYVKSSSSELVNKVTQGEYPPGSVFKIAVAAAALEQGMSPDQTFVCRGSETINGKTVKCKTGGESGHGAITLKEAFAKSCNCAFIQAGKKAGAEAVLDMARQLGAGQTAMEGYPGEKEGNLMTVQQASGAAIANLSIGQGELLMTPLQVARMTNIVADGGIDPGTHILLEDIVSKEDRLDTLPRIISEKTAEELSQMMAQTMATGTGSGVKADVSMAGKTGSAESYMGGREVVHGWMTGFVPAQEPEYTITVFIENGQSGSSSAAPIFAKIAQYLSESASFERSVDF